MHAIMKTQLFCLQTEAMKHDNILDTMIISSSLVNAISLCHSVPLLFEVSNIYTGSVDSYRISIQPNSSKSDQIVSGCLPLDYVEIAESDGSYGLVI